MSRFELHSLLAKMALWRVCWLYPLHALYVAHVIGTRAEFERLAMLPIASRKAPGQPPSGPTQRRS